jgi:tRNA(Ile)-lysidine synthase
MTVPGERIGVAVSGGADSIALLRLLESLRDELGVTLAVLHFDHQLRGAESDLDAMFVAELAGASGHEFILEKEDVAATAARNGWNIEDAARRLRYAFFDRLAAEGRVTKIAVAHTLDDQAETVLAHLIRGSGISGLAGIYPIAGTTIRPLIATRRAPLRRLLESSGQSWREDSTNRDVRRMRSRIRERLLPLLEQEFSPAIATRLAELARLAREEEEFWDTLVEERFQALARKVNFGYAIEIRELFAPLAAGTPSSGSRKTNRREAGLPLRTLTERLIRRLYEEVRGDRKELTARHVEQVIRLAAESTSGHQIDLPGNISVSRDFGDLSFAKVSGGRVRSDGRNGRTQGKAYQYIVSLPDRGGVLVSIPEIGMGLSLKVIDWPLPESDTKRDGQALDADLLRTALILRNWRPGDTYQPLGRSRPRKLKQMFSAGRIPHRDRAHWPVLECGGKVVWTRGMPVAADFSAQGATRVGVLIEEVWPRGGDGNRL